MGSIPIHATRLLLQPARAEFEVARAGNPGIVAAELAVDRRSARGPCEGALAEEGAGVPGAVPQ